MNFARGDSCYILESNVNVRAAKVINKQGKFYVIQLVGSCGAIRLPENRLFRTEEEAENSKKKSQNKSIEVKNDFGYVDVFQGRRKGEDPHKYERY